MWRPRYPLRCWQQVSGEDDGREEDLELVDVGLSITATDVCTPNPNVAVRVYSDEVYLKDADSWKDRTV